MNLLCALEMFFWGKYEGENVSIELSKMLVCFCGFFFPPSKAPWIFGKDCMSHQESILVEFIL